MDINSALQKIFSMHQFTIKLGLERIHALLELIGNPHLELKCFHIAGSNGKGSTASFLASILTEAGFNTGLYTSPHFVKFNERIRINGKEIDDEYIASFIESLGDFIDKNEPTFFEITTALAFNYFAHQNVDFAVIETGLGGRLDATNTINPLASIITSISLEHTNILGDTIKKIAGEKAGIIKQNSKVFTGYLPPEAIKVIHEKVAENNCREFRSEDFISKINDHLSIKLKNKNFQLYKTPLAGAHQLNNAALAIKAANEILDIEDDRIINNGINIVVLNTGIHGRYEVVNDSPKLIFDSAHNPEGVQIFIEEFKREFQNYDDTILIFGAMRDKNIPEMLNTLSRFFSRVYLTKIDYERSADPNEIISQLGAGIQEKIQIIGNAVDFIDEYRQQIGNKCLVVLGSMYLVGEIKSKMMNKKLDKKG